MPQASPVISNKASSLNQSGAAIVSPQLQRPNQAQNKPLVGPGSGQKPPLNQANPLNRSGLNPQQQQQQKGLNASPAPSVASPSAFNAPSTNLQQNRSANNNSPFNSISNNKSKEKIFFYLCFFYPKGIKCFKLSL